MREGSLKAGLQIRGIAHSRAMNSTHGRWWLVGTLLAALILLSDRVPIRAANAPANDELQIPATDDGLPGAGPIRRYDWFRRLWLERRTVWAGRVNRDQQSLVLLGDSITQGWGED